MRRFARVGFLSSLSIAAAGCVEQPTVDTDTAEIIGGSVDTDDPAVVYISTVANGEGSACSGSLISPRVVLTAAHCIDLGTITSQSVYFGSSRSSDPVRVEEIDTVDRIFFPNWGLGLHDIAMVLLEHDAVTQPIPINRTALGSGSSGNIGDPLRLVGWGQTSGTGGAGTKRQVTATLQSFDSDELVYGTASANTCQGDSGGPSFLTINNQEVIAGITSYGITGCLGRSGATRVDRHVSFIDSWVAEKDIPMPPTADIVRPADGATVKSGFAVQVAATDNTRIVRVELYIDGQHTPPDAVLDPYFFDTPALPDGPVMLEVRSYDNRGAMTSDSVSVSVDSSCRDHEDCLGNLVCDDGTCVEGDGGLGQPCVDSADCNSGLCGMTSEGNLCTQTCDLAAADCPSGFECIDAGGMSVCWPKEGGGCSIAASSRTSFLLLALALAPLAFRRRRPRSIDQ